jgi:hypothetical protein
VGDKTTAIHESVPELIIYCFPFLYLIFLMLTKWGTDWEGLNSTRFNDI